MREEMASAEDDDNDPHSGLPLSSLERDVIMSESEGVGDDDDYSSLKVHAGLGLGGAGHRSLFSVSPCSIEYQY